MHKSLQQPTNTKQTRHPTIVCIDDDPDIANAIALILSKYDVEVIPAYTGQQGIWQTLCNDADLVITDCRMPQGEGELVLTYLKSLPRTWFTPVVVLTGLRDPQRGGHMRRLGAAGYLTKPVSTAQLLAEIGKHVKLKERDEYSERAR